MKKIGLYISVFYVLLSLLSCSSRTAAHAGQEVSLDKQRIVLGGVSNSRQFGGYVIGDKTVRRDVLLRSGNLSKATDGAVDTLRDIYHLKYVFDFRTSFEREPFPDRPIEGADNIWLPCMQKAMESMAASGIMKSRPSGDVGQMAEAMLELVGNPAAVKLAEDMYPGIVFDQASQKSYCAFLDSLTVLPEGRAAIWHCSQGKDRCGWGSALLLAALGADRDLIVADFALSNVSYQPLIDKILEAARERNYTDAQLNAVYALIGVSVDNFNKTYDEILARYGSMDAYLSIALECDAAQRDILRAKFLQ